MEGRGGGKGEGVVANAYKISESLKYGYSGGRPPCPGDANEYG